MKLMVRELDGAFSKINAAMLEIEATDPNTGLLNKAVQWE